MRFLRLILTGVLVILSSSRVPLAQAQLSPRLSTSSCASDSECEKNYKCFIQDGTNSGFCIPKDFYGSEGDEEMCLHRANCGAAAALRRVCPACTIAPIFTCGGVPASDEWYREHWERFKDCFTPNPEQISASAVQSDPRSNHRVKGGGPKEIEERPDLGVYVNQWNISVPAEWAGSSSHASLQELNRRKGRVEIELNHLWQFNAPCPIFEEDSTESATTSRLIAGTCGAYRNPDPMKPAPSLPYLPNK